ncbi:unnamed protein product [Musa textilis]
MALCLLLACCSSLVCEDCLAGEHCSLRKRDPKKREKESPLKSGCYATRNTDGKKTWRNLTKDKWNLWGRDVLQLGTKADGWWAPLRQIGLTSRELRVRSTRLDVVGGPSKAASGIFVVQPSYRPFRSTCRRRSPIEQRRWRAAGSATALLSTTKQLCGDVHTATSITGGGSVVSVPNQALPGHVLSPRVRLGQSRVQHHAVLCPLPRARRTRRGQTRLGQLPAQLSLPYMGAWGRGARPCCRI